MADPEPHPDDFLEPLTEEACARLLAATEFGRLAVVEAGRPRIVVLNHIAEAGHLLFRTRDDAFLAGLTCGDVALPAVYEVDSAFPVGHTGWSVIAAGTLVREVDPHRVTLARSMIVAWAEGERDLVLRLDIEKITGRRAGREVG
jgi:hypothetical protein